MEKLEIEYKFFIESNQLEPLNKTLKNNCSASWHYDKEDIYYRHKKEYEHLDIRIRKNMLDNDPCTQKSVLSYKYEDAIEWASKEYETVVDDVEVITQLIKKLGYEKYGFKHKVGWAYTLDIPSEHKIYIKNLASYLLAELSYIDSLGYYLELEILCNINAQPKEIEEIKDYIFQYATHELALSESQIEKRAYMEMLA